MPAKRDAPSVRTIPTIARWVLGIAGTASWSAGSVATFATVNGAGAVALIAAGVGAAGIGIIGRWPSKVAISGNEFTWAEIDETVQSQIETARDDDGNPAALRELETLKNRLDELQRTGAVAEHPAARYDREVLAALHRVLPAADIMVRPTRSGDLADFLIQARGQRILVETKWRLGEAGPFKGSTLSRITAHLGSDDRLLVVSNASVIDPAAAALRSQIGGRGMVVSWRSPGDDDSLAEAVAKVTT